MLVKKQTSHGIEPLSQNRIQYYNEEKENVLKLLDENVNAPLNTLYFLKPSEVQDILKRFITFLLMNKIRLYYQPNSSVPFSENTNILNDDLLKLTTRPEEILMLEDEMISFQVIHKDRNYFKNKRLENLKCLHGVFLLLEKHAYFKRVYTDEFTKQKLVTHHQTLRAFNNRYHIKRIRNISEEEKSVCIEKALNRLPLLRKLIENTPYIKYQTR